PMVIRQSPGASTRSGPRSFTFTFSEPMNTTSFSVASDVISFTGPGGVDLKPQITGFTWVNSLTLRVDFNRQLTQANYTLLIGPQIRACDNGHASDQDRAGIPGETTQDRYSAPPSYFLGYRASATALEAIDLEPGAAGVFTILDGVDDGATAVNLGTNKFNFFG